MGLPQTGFLDNQVMKIVHQGKCLGRKQKLRLKSEREDNKPLTNFDHLTIMLLILQEVVSAWVWWTGTEGGSVGVCMAATPGATWLHSRTVPTLEEEEEAEWGGPTPPVSTDCINSDKTPDKTCRDMAWQNVTNRQKMPEVLNFYLFPRIGYLWASRQFLEFQN